LGTFLWTIFKAKPEAESKGDEYLRWVFFPSVWGNGFLEVLSWGEKLNEKEEKYTKPNYQRFQVFYIGRSAD
jgi:hypothetical protein